MPAIERLMLDGQPEPVSHYCHVTKAGNLVWVSGTVGIGPDGSIPDDVVEQFALAIANMDACLKAVGAGAEHVVKMTVYLTNVADRQSEFGGNGFRRHGMVPGDQPHADTGIGESSQNACRFGAGRIGDSE